MSSTASESGATSRFVGWESDAEARARGTRRPREGASRLHMAATWTVAVTAMLAPLPFGSVENVWPAAWCVPLALALALFDTSRLRPAHVVMLAAVAAVAAAIGLLAWLQTMPDLKLPTHPIWLRAEQLLGGTVPKTISVDPQATWAALSRPLLILLAFLCAFMAATERQGAALLLKVVAYAGAAYAFHGVATLLLDPSNLLWTEKTSYVEDLTGTFVNRNTAATFFGLVLILWFVTFLSELDKKVPRSALGIRDIGSALLDAPPRALVVATGCTALSFIALMLTRSRAGILFSLVAMFLTAVLVMRHRMSGRSGLIAAASILALVGAVVLELFGGAVAGRIGTQGLVDGGRLSTYRSSFAMIADTPWLGTGLGTFRDAFPAYRNPDLSTIGLWDRAHSTPIEIAVELGLPAAALVVCLWIAGLGRLLHGAVTRRRDSDIPAAAFGIGLLGSLHSLVDFSPQIPGFAVVWVAVLGCGLAQSVRGEPAAARRPAPFAIEDGAGRPPAGDAT